MSPVGRLISLAAGASGAVGAGLNTMVETWRGIYPITSFVLEALGRKRDASIDGRLSPEEQTLLTAVEFWAAAAHGTLQQHLRPDVRVRLETARRAFAVIGAVRVVSLLRVAAEELAEGPQHQSESAVIDQLDERLARTDDNIEDLIARYAGVIERSAESAAAQ
ncbi:MAG TPA: hypothetical protein VMT83_14215 [Burkholderiaceae bacterium]|nr:hypothetical protein [Burkholderiaceae bacterium]